MRKVTLSAIEKSNFWGSDCVCTVRVQENLFWQNILFYFAKGSFFYKLLETREKQGFPNYLENFWLTYPSGYCIFCQKTCIEMRILKERMNSWTNICSTPYAIVYKSFYHPVTGEIETQFWPDLCLKNTFIILKKWWRSWILFWHYWLNEWRNK